VPLKVIESRTARSRPCGVPSPPDHAQGPTPRDGDHRFIREYVVALGERSCTTRARYASGPPAVQRACMVGQRCRGSWVVGHGRARACVREGATAAPGAIRRGLEQRRPRLPSPSGSQRWDKPRMTRRTTDWNARGSWLGRRFEVEVRSGSRTGGNAWRGPMAVVFVRNACPEKRVVVRGQRGPRRSFCTARTRYEV